MSANIRVARVEPGPLWSISSNYFSRNLVEHAKSIPGISFDGPSRSWRGYIDAAAALVARLASVGIHVDGASELPAADNWRTARTPFLFSASGLRDYQVEGVRFLIAKSREGALLADGMRLGKSLQSLIAARAFKQKTLIVCPSHVVGVWGRSKDAPEGPGEIAKWWPDAWRGIEGAGEGRRGHGVVCLETVKPFKHSERVRQAGLVRTAADKTAIDAARLGLEAFSTQLETAQVLICHYDIVYAWVDVILQWGMQTLILDELHVCAGYQSRRAAALKTLAAAARNRIGLTGTPVTGALKTLHNMLEILSPRRFGFYFIPPPLDAEKQWMASYARVFCESHQETVGAGEATKTFWMHDGRANMDMPDGELTRAKEETLQHRLQYLMLRRLKRDVDPQLPTKVRQIVDVAIPARKTISISDKILGKGGDELRQCLDLAADAKLKPVVELVSGHIAETEKVVCGCFRRLFAERVAADVKKKVGRDTLIEFVHGGLTQRERDRRIHKVRQHAGPALLAGTIDTISTGLDLSFAGVMVVAELTYEPQDLVQLEERLYEYGKEAKALIQYVIARGTADELILRAIINKLDTFERVIGSTGDEMKVDLARKREDPMKRLYAAMFEMQKAAPVTKTIRRSKKLSRES